MRSRIDSAVCSPSSGLHRRQAQVSESLNPRSLT
jgi:hypothetical protein